MKRWLICFLLLAFGACGDAGEASESDAYDVDGSSDDVADVHDTGEDLSEPDIINDDAVDDTTDDSVDEDIPSPPPGDLDTAASGMTTEPESTPADGLTQLAVTISLLDTNGDPLGNVPVSLEVENAQGVVVIQPLPTSDNGLSVGHLVAIDGGKYQVSAKVGTGDDAVYLDNALEVTFTGCTTTADYYRRTLQGPVFSICTGCHNEYGLALEWGNLWRIDDRLDELTVATTLDTLGTLAVAQDEEPPMLLGKPSGQAKFGHYGGTLVPIDSVEYAHLQAFVARLQNSDASCDAPKEDFFGGVELMSNEQAFHRAALMLTKRLPTALELKKLAESDDLEQVIEDDLLEDPAFYVRLQDLFNDLLHTDRQLGPFKLNAHLGVADYPNRFYFRPYQPNKAKYNVLKYTCEALDAASKGGTCCHSGSDNNIMCEHDGKTMTLCAIGDKEGTQTLRRQALALIAYVVKNDKPFTEILTADYVMVNPITARVFELPDGKNKVTFEDDCDLADYKPVKLQMDNQQGVTEQNTYPSNRVPHAGIFSTHTFLNRYMTTTTNLNRNRASEAYYKFVDFNLQKLVTFTIGQSDALPLNPTKDAFSCSVCHTAMDPVAGAFVKWTGLGRVRRGRYVQVCSDYLEKGVCAADQDCAAGEKCVETTCVSEDYDERLCVRPQGYKGVIMPKSEERAPLRWMTQQMAKDPRFATTMVRVMLTLLTGRDKLTAPSNIYDLDYAFAARAYAAQEAEVARVTKVFVAENYNFKKALVEIVKGQWFRAVNGNEANSNSGELLLGQVGGGRLLSPEELNSRIRAVTGFPWISIKGRVDSLLSVDDGFRLLYGGIDSDSILKRTRDPFTLASSVARRMSNEMACLLVPQDMAWNDSDDRRYFASIQDTTVPLNDAGNSINQAAIESTIIGLHKGLLNEDIVVGSKAYEETYDLFVEVWQSGQDLLAAGTEATVLPSQCRATKDVMSGKQFFESQFPNRSPVNQDPKYVLRAWMSVVSYLLSDASFLMQ